jgi:large subunit ribosomal protein L10
MAITKAKKGEILSKIKEGLKHAKSLVFVNFHGLPVSGATELRRSLRGEGIGYFVAKKTLIRKAFADETLEGSMPELPGEIALAYGEDLMAPAKGVYEFQKKNPDMVKIVGGVFEGKFMDASAMMAIATIPPREVLLAQFLNLINSPIQGLAVAVNEIAKSRN